MMGTNSMLMLFLIIALIEFLSPQVCIEELFPWMGTGTMLQVIIINVVLKCLGRICALWTELNDVKNC